MDEYIVTGGHLPTVEEIKAARAEAGLTQQQAAALIYVSYETWKTWEAARESKRSAQMPAMAWELFLNKRFIA
ncbi:hypothetical protein B0T49_21235 [Chromobacterium violaceum]|uniref:helix-turn-helix domain-containing protein n=1 Tax=Chromobacterium violaceum TaxID=536 RepID=UPI0009DB3A42|nr:helix-turn-helix domain-containing protein [Chromobacterium violaceum]OQS45683.1 hypothetical protein B0T49_21235 [Chromobacterium violaceum]OQS47839.1 hypothetical protein B0T48_12205 [Chromobacterium violaceum]